MQGLSLTPIAWGFGIGLGAALALLRGASAPGWGLALAFLSILVLFSLGTLKEDDGDELRHALRFVVGLSIAYLLVTIPLSWVGLTRWLDRGPDTAERLARAALIRHELVARWAVIALAVPGGMGALWLRLRRDEEVAPRP